MSIIIPENRAARHGGHDFYSSGVKFAETLILWADLNKSDNVLDVGCGPGRIAIGIGNTIGWETQYTGLDVIKIDIEVAKAHITSVHENFEFRHLDVFNGLYNPKGKIEPKKITFPVKESEFTMAFCASLFTHMFDADVERYLSNISRAMSPGGRVLTTWFIVDEEVEASIKTGKARFEFAHALEDGTLTDRIDRPEEVIAFRRERVLELFARAGLHVDAFHQGAWSHVLPKGKARHSQDCFVCSKVA